MPAPTPYVVTIAVDAVIEALGAFITPFVPAGTQIVRGQQNRTAMPPDAFVLLTEVLKVDLSTPIETNAPENAQISVMSPKRIDVQVDFFGPASCDQIAAVKGVYRTSYAVRQFPAGIAPLFCTDERQTSLTNAEQQYEDRWTLTASLEYNPTVYLPQQFATALKVNILEDLL